jgi:hypothetical protein
LVGEFFVNIDSKGKEKTEIEKGELKVSNSNSIEFRSFAEKL